jgi:hypothetical protein
MAITFQHRGKAITVDTPREAAELLEMLKQQDAEDAKKRAWGRAAVEWGGPGTGMEAFIVEEFGAWAPGLFLAFIERLGGPQRKALAFLTERGSATDEELREALGARGNQALAGILSGISKQAAALDIPARDIFRFENRRTAGKRHSTYAVADKFLRIARDMSWPVQSQNNT